MISIEERVRKALALAEQADCPVQLKHIELRIVVDEIDTLRAVLAKYAEKTNWSHVYTDRGRRFVTWEGEYTQPPWQIAQDALKDE